MYYAFVSPVVVKVDNDDGDYSTNGAIEVINIRLGYDGTDLAEYLDNLKDVVTGITMTVHKGTYGGIDCHTKCDVTREISSKEMNNLTDYITGQFSDGWGEGFEQDELSVDGDPIYASFWNDEDWQIRLSSFAKD